jgi:phage-related protein
MENFISIILGIVAGLFITPVAYATSFFTFSAQDMTDIIGYMGDLLSGVWPFLLLILGIGLGIAVWRGLSGK